MTRPTQLSPADKMKIDQLTVDDIVVDNPTFGPMDIAESLNAHFKSAFGFNGMFPQEIKDEDLRKAMADALGSANAQRNLNDTLKRPHDQSTSAADCAYFYKALASLAISQLRRTSAIASDIQAHPSSEYQICSLAQTIWSDCEGLGRQDAYVIATLLLLDAKPSIPVSPFHPPLTLDLCLPNIAAQLVKAQRGDSLAEKLLYELQAPLYYNGRRYRSPTQRELAEGHAPNQYGKVFFAGEALSVPVADAVQAMRCSRAFERLGERLAKAAGLPTGRNQGAFYRALTEQCLVDALYPVDQRRSGYILEFELFNAGNEHGRLHEIRLDLTNSVQDSLGGIPAVAELAGEFLMHHFAPELLLNEAPPDFRYREEPRSHNLRKGAFLLLLGHRDLVFAAAEEAAAQPEGDQAAMLDTLMHKSLANGEQPHERPNYCLLAHEELSAFADRLMQADPELLLAGLRSTETITDQPSLAMFAQHLESMFPTAGAFKDDELAASLLHNFGVAATQQTIKAMIFSAQVPPLTNKDLHRDWPAILNPDFCLRLLQKLARHTLRASDEAWVPLAIGSALNAPSMQAFSFATELVRKHPTLSADSCLRLGSVLLPASTPHPLPPLIPLPDTRALAPSLPPFNTWCSATRIDDVFDRTGLQLLCMDKQGQRHLRLPAWQTWQAMMSSSSFATLLRPLLENLGWYGSRPGDVASPRTTQALAARAMVEHFLAATEPLPQSVEDYFHQHWVTNFTHEQLCEKVREQISARNPDISPASLSLLEYLLFREVAPELLIADTPDGLYYGRSLQSVTLMHGARLLEMHVPGASCEASYDDVLLYPQQTSELAITEIQQQWPHALVVPALRYAHSHGALPAPVPKDIRQATQDQIKTALAFIRFEQMAFAEDLRLFLMAPPDRKAIAEEQLTHAGVSKVYWDKWPATETVWNQLHHCGLRKSWSFPWHQSLTTPGALHDLGMPAEKPHLETLTQLLMSGDVYREGEPSINELYEQAFTAFKNQWLSATANLSKRLFMELPPALRNTLHTATCEVSRVKFDQQEGSTGLFIRCLPGDHREDFIEHKAATEHYFELVPSAGIIRPCIQTFAYNQTSPDTWDWMDVIIDGGVSLNLEEKKRLARETPMLVMDSDAYIQGRPSRSSQQLHTPLKGTLVPSMQLTFADGANEADFFKQLADTGVAHLYGPTLEKLKHTHERTTPWEQEIALQKRVAHEFARMLLPFYGCVADLIAKEYSRGMILGCTVDAVAALTATGVFLRAAGSVVREAGRLTVRASCETMGAALQVFMGHLAAQSPALGFIDLGKLVYGLSKAAWQALSQPVLHWLQPLSEASRSAYMTQEGVYWLSTEASAAMNQRHPEDTLVRLGSTERAMVRNVGTEGRPNFKMLDPYDDLPYGPRLTSEEPSTLHILNEPGSISSNHYPLRIVPALTEDQRLSMAIDDACKVRVRYKGAGHYDFDIDGHYYRLNTEAPAPTLTELSGTPVAELEDINSWEVACRPRRDLEETMCTPFTLLTSRPAERFLANQGSTLTRGQEISQAFEARAFQLERRSVAATDQAPARSLDLLVFDGQFCKWDHGPIKGTRPVKFTQEKKLLALGKEEREFLNLPETPDYNPLIKGRLSSQRNFGLLAETSGNKAKAISPHVPVVELEQVARQVADKRTLRGICFEWSTHKNVYVEVDSGKFYKAAQGPGELTFKPVTEPDEVDEYLRLSNQYRFVAERPYSATDRDNIARLLYNALVEKNEPSLQDWLASSPTNRNYDTYAKWCIDHHQRNDMLHYAENILSAEGAQTRLVEETKGLIPDWKPIGQRNPAEKKEIADILNVLLPVQGKEDLWLPLTASNIDQEKVARMVSMQMNNSNLAFASILTQDGEKFVYYALAGGKRAKALQLKPYLPQQPVRKIGDTTYVDARALMGDRLPDPSITSLPVIRHAGRVRIRPFDRYLDSERLIATIVKERHPKSSLYSIGLFTRMDTCRSCGGIVLPQLTLWYAEADFWVTYIDKYQQ